MLKVSVPRLFVGTLKQSACTDVKSLCPTEAEKGKPKQTLWHWWAHNLIWFTTKKQAFLKQQQLL